MQELYDKVIGPRLGNIEKDVKSTQTNVEKVLKLLIGDNDHPDKPGICERLRKIESSHKKVRRIACWAAGILGGVWLTANASNIFAFLSKILSIKGNG